MTPLVSVICMCYNHEQFVVEALESVNNQTYSEIELIIVDDGSTDRSAVVIRKWVDKNQTSQFLDLQTNHGYCKAFNIAFAKAKGEYIINLAADDMLHPDRIREGVEGFLLKGQKYGLQFSDASYIDAKGQLINKHSDRFPHHSVPQGDVYVQVVQRYFVSPTIMVRKSVLDELGGFDENLFYEDFDLWIRISRNHYFFYIPKELISKRILPGSLGHKQYAKNSNQMESTYLVCKKIFNLNRSEEERKALNKRILYELKWNLRFLHLRLIVNYLILLAKNKMNYFRLSSPNTMLK